MGMMIESVLTVVLFCISSSWLIKEALKPIPLVNQTAYSKKALRVEKTYRVASWSVMTLVFFVSLVFSFTEVLTQL